MALSRFRETRAIFRIVAQVAAILLLAGCALTPKASKYGPESPVTTITVPVEPLEYAPLVPKLPIIAGIYYSPEFRMAVATAGGGDFPRYRYEIGAATIAIFEQDIAALFNRLVVLSSSPTAAGDVAGVDLVLVPRFERMPLYFRLAADVFAADGSSVASITPRPSMLPAPERGAPSASGSTSVGVQQSLADSVGDLTTTFVLSQEVAQWGRANGHVWQWPESHPSSVATARPNGVAIVACVDLLDCTATDSTVAIGQALHKLDPTITIVSAQEVRRAFHPWLGNVDLSDSQAAQLLRQPAVGARARAIGVRFLVVAESLVSKSIQEHHHPDVQPTLAWWSNSQSAKLQVFDFLTAANAGNVKHHREDTTLVLPLFFTPISVPAPIPMPSGGESLPDAVATQLLPLVRPPH